MKSLTDVVSGAGLAGYAEIALLVFLAAFVAIVMRLTLGANGSLDAAARLPLDDEAAPVNTDNPSLTRDARGVVHVKR